jgi:hypothetical protein
MYKILHIDNDHTTTTLKNVLHNLRTFSQLAVKSVTGKQYNGLLLDPVLSWWNYGLLDLGMSLAQNID